ncbi:MAG: LOG family protein [Arenicellales bacterium]|nr:LOG family protein [Arenicellales bacterium]
MKAYKNPDFLDSPDARLLRIVSEYVEPASRFAQHDIEDTIVFMGSARIAGGEDALDSGQSLASGDPEATHQRKMAMYYDACRELAFRLTQWSKDLPQDHRRFVVCSGGGPGIMEAANRGASDAAGINVGLGISLPNEQENNPYITRELSLEFHYFFMRKFWFAYLAKAVILFPGGFGTLDELFEILTLVQTGKVRKHLPLVLFGSDYWNRVINFEALIDYGTISRKDLDLFLLTDSVDEAFTYLTVQLSRYGVKEPGATL